MTMWAGLDAARLSEGPPSADADFPFVLSAGERRAFTANTIRDAYERHVMTREAGASEVVLSGGGTRNATLVQHIEQALAPLDLTLRVLDDEASDAKEAIGFALLAEATLRGVPANVLGATGACGARILGRVSLGGRSA